MSAHKNPAFAPILKNPNKNPQKSVVRSHTITKAKRSIGICVRVDELV